MTQQNYYQKDIETMSREEMKKLAFTKNSMFDGNGKIIALEYCRTHNVPTLGIVLGMQCMAIEFARNVLGIADANSTEMAPTKNNVIDLIETLTVVSSENEYIRSGAYDCEIAADSLAAQIYGKTSIAERHRNRYEFNNAYKEKFEKAYAEAPSKGKKKKCKSKGLGTHHGRERSFLHALPQTPAGGCEMENLSGRALRHHPKNRQGFANSAHVQRDRNQQIENRG